LIEEAAVIKNLTPRALIRNPESTNLAAQVDEHMHTKFIQYDPAPRRGGSNTKEVTCPRLILCYADPLQSAGNIQPV
jgi:hypothetical protein